MTNSASSWKAVSFGLREVMGGGGGGFVQTVLLPPLLFQTQPSTTTQTLNLTKKMVLANMLASLVSWFLDASIGFGNPSSLKNTHQVLSELKRGIEETPILYYQSSFLYLFFFFFLFLLLNKSVENLDTVCCCDDVLSICT